MISINTFSVDWKGATISQIAPSLRLNVPDAPTGNAIFKSRPLRSYRREIVTAPVYAIPRSNFRMDNYPGAMSVTTSSNTVDITYADTYDYPDNAGEHPGSVGEAGCSLGDTCLSTAQNARNRVRGGANMTQKYCNSTAQYLRSRNECTVACSTANTPISNYPDSSSARTLKTKYENITRAAASYTDVYGAATANELAYSSNTSTAYTLKTRMGFPLTTYPSFSNQNVQSIACDPPRG